MLCAISFGALGDNYMKEKIENFVDGVIKKNDFELLDILWTFSYSIPSMSGYHKNKESFKKWSGVVCERNLQKKYNLKLIEVKEKMMIFVDFLDSMPNFLSKETFNEDDKLLREVLVNKSSKFLVQNIKYKIQDLSDLDKKILSFVLNYIPVRIQDSIKEAEKEKQKNPNYGDKYGFLFDFQVITNRETGDIVYFEIDPEKWTYIFNPLFNEELKEQRFKTKSRSA